MLPVILTLLATTVAAPAVEAPSQDPAIRVWLNKSGYVERADKVRAYVRTGVDGYVMILHAEPSGRVRVLFPLDPEDDGFVRAGRDYEIRSRSDKEAFAVYDGTGTGVVLAAVAHDPFRFDGLVLNRHWDYRAAEFGVGNDAEADLLALVQRMTGGGWFEYDVVRYDVGSYYAGDYVDGESGEAYHLSLYGPGVAGHYWGGGVGFSIGFGVGWYDPWYYPYYGYGWYSPWYWNSCCYGYGYPYAYYPYYGYPYYGYPYYGYPSYGYPGYGYPYYGGTYARHVYPAGGYGGAWGTYAFKSSDDRYGLNPQSVTARRRTTGTGAAYASSSSRTPASTSRRTAAASTPVSSPTTPGSLEARRRPTGATSATVLPTISGRGRTAAPQGTSATGAASSADGRRTVGDARAPATTGDVTRRGLEITPPGRAVTPQDADRRAAGTAGSRSSNPNGLRQVEPRRIDDAPARSGQGTVGSGRTTNPSSGSLERRSPSRSATPPRSATPSRSPSRTASPPRSAPSTRSAPSAPRAAPSRGPTRGSSPSRGSSPPSGGRRRN